MYSKIALSIGGSDSGGGAGRQADLRTFMALKVHGCSVITCITAQNSREVTCVEPVENNTLLSQLDTLFADFDIDALKTGMLLNEMIINDTASKLNTYKITKIIDPVMVTRTGSKLLEDSAINAYKKLLLPNADLVTPNIYEANLLCGAEITNKEHIENSARNIIPEKALQEVVVLILLLKIINDDLGDQAQILFCKNFLKTFQQIILLFVLNQLAQNLTLYKHK